jgi:GGDEF domain-containing protein
MKRLRVRFLILIAWLIVLFNTERFLYPINLSDVTYSLVVAIVILTLAFPRFIKVPTLVVLTGSIIILLVIKYWAGFPVLITDVVIGISEVFAVVSTVLLSNWVYSGIDDFENAVEHITIGHVDRLSKSSLGGESVLYREVRRARNHKRPLALLAISVDEKSIQSSLDRIVKETQATMAQHYALSGVSKILCNSMEDCDVIVQQNNHFLIVLPETSPEDMPRLIERLRRKVQDGVGVELKVGTATLPKDGLTFEGLIDKATLEMMEDKEKIPAIELSQIPSEKIKN